MSWKCCDISWFFFPCRIFQRLQRGEEEHNERCAHLPAGLDVGELRRCAAGAEIRSGDPRKYKYAIYSLLIINTYVKVVFRYIIEMLFSFYSLRLKKRKQFMRIHNKTIPTRFLLFVFLLFLFSLM